MRVSKQLQVVLDPEEFERLETGEPIQIPVDQEQAIVLYPPQEDDQ